MHADALDDVIDACGDRSMKDAARAEAKRLREKAATMREALRSIAHLDVFAPSPEHASNGEMLARVREVAFAAITERKEEG